jgi:hypothetical protein
MDSGGLDYMHCGHAFLESGTLFSSHHFLERDDISFVRTTETGLDGCRHETFCDTLGWIGVLNFDRETVRMVIFI